MSENSTSSPWLLPFPSSVGRVNLGATDFQELAERCTTIFGEKFLVVKTSAFEVTAKAGELVEMTAAGTVNFPKAAAANTIVGVFARAGEVTVKTTGAEKIVGGSLPEAGTSITLSTGQYVVVQYDGTRYLVVSGIPKGYIAGTQLASEAVSDAKVIKGRALVETENGYEARTGRAINTPVEPNPTRMTSVIVEAILEVEEWGISISAETEIGRITGASNRENSLSFLVPPKVKWKWEKSIASTGTPTVFSRYLFL